MLVIAKRRGRYVVSAPPAVYLQNVRAESYVKANAVGEKRLISALSMPSQRQGGAHFLAH